MVFMGLLSNVLRWVHTGFEASVRERSRSHGCPGRGPQRPPEAQRAWRRRPTGSQQQAPARGTRGADRAYFRVQSVDTGLVSFRIYHPASSGWEFTWCIHCAERCKRVISSPPEPCERYYDPHFKDAETETSIDCGCLVSIPQAQLEPICLLLSCSDCLSGSDSCRVI